jgi:hypothetical protein
MKQKKDLRQIIRAHIHKFLNGRLPDGYRSSIYISEVKAIYRYYLPRINKEFYEEICNIFRAADYVIFNHWFTAYEKEVYDNSHCHVEQQTRKSERLNSKKQFLTI